MLGVTNAKYNADFEFTPDNSVDLTFLAGGRIDKGDLVEIISEDLPKDYPRYQQDTNIQAALGTLSKPTRLDKNPNVYQAFHMNTNAWQSNTNVYSTCWRTSLHPITHANTIGSINTLLSEIPAYSWSEPYYIGDGFWLIAGMGSSGAGVSHANDYPGGGSYAAVSYSAPVQVLLIHVDQQSGLAIRCDVEYGPCGWNDCCYGKPIICQISEDEFVLGYYAYLSSVYQIMARTFKVTKNMDDPTNYQGTVQWLCEPVSLFPSSGKFIFYGHTCNFANRENRDVYFTLQDEISYTHLRVDEHGIINVRPTKQLSPDLKCVNEYAPLYGYNYTYMHCVMDYYNNFGGYNHITTTDNRHFLSIYNYYYWDYTIDYDTNVITAKLYPMQKNFNRRVLFYQWQNEADNGTRTARDWDLATNYLTSSICNLTTTAASSRIPFLWKLSDDRYLMAYSGIITQSAASTTMSQNYRENMYIVVDFNDILHKIECNATYGYGGFLYNNSYPEGNYVKPLIFTDSEDRIQMIVPRYEGTYYNNGQHVVPDTPLNNAQIHNLAYKFGTHKTQNDMMKHPYCYGIAKHSVLPGEKITIAALVENDNCGIEEKGETK